MFVALLLLCFTAAAGAKRPTMTGQPREVSVRNSKVWRAARFAVSELNQANLHEPFSYKILNVTSAKVQVVAGLNYIIEVQLKLKCKKRQYGKCHYKYKELCCDFTVTEIPWQNERFVYRRRCTPQKHD